MTKFVRGTLLRAYARIPAVARRNLHAWAPDPVRSSLKKARRYLTTPNRGVVTVVVPCYNVAPYLAQCLDSILCQDYPYLEVLVVDDGSPDESPQIAKEAARRDRRIKVISRQNGGLGAARNTGIRAATGTYITFVDSDDTIPQGSIKAMVTSLDQTGSDFVVGSLQRVEGDRRWTPNWARSLHDRDQLRLTLSDVPDVLKDVFAWNKLFRRDFFDRVVHSFPEGIRYEDQEPTAKAYVGARSFDLLKRSVYSWAVRGDGTSITQQKATVRDLTDRLRVLRHVEAVLSGGASSEVLRSWQAKAIGFDLHSYYLQVPRTNQDYWQILSEGVTHLADRMDAQAWLEVPVYFRVLALTTLRGTREQVGALLTAQQECGSAYRLERSGGRLLARPGYVYGLALPLEDGDFVVPDDQVKLRAELTRSDWVNERELVVEGYAYLGGVDAYQNPTTISARLIRLDDRGDVLDSMSLDLDRLELPQIDIRSGDAENRYGPTGFHARIDTGKLLDRSSEEEDHITWRLELNVEALGLARVGYFERVDTRGPAGTFSLGPHLDGRRIALHFGSGLGLGLSVPHYRVLVDEFQLRDRALRIVVSCRGGATPQNLVLVSRQLKHRITVPGQTLANGRVVFNAKVPRIPRSMSTPRDVQWTIRAATSDGELQLQMPQSTAELQSAFAQDRLRPELSLFGFLRLRDSAWRVMVTGCHVDGDGQLRVEGVARIPSAQSLDLVLSGVSDIPPLGPVEHDRVSGRFRARFSFLERSWPMSDRGALAPMGGRALKVLTGGAAKPSEGYWPAVEPALMERFPEETGLERVRIELSCTPKGRSLWVNLAAPLKTDERGSFAQRQLQRQYTESEPKPRNAVLLECFNGRSAGDSVLAVGEELAHRNSHIARYWSIRDYSSVIPSGDEALLMYSREWYAGLRDIAMLVSNNNFPFFFRKRSHQFYLQTWHGTPLKRIGNDVPSANLSLSYRALMKREAEYWDTLLCQNPFSRKVLPSALGFQGAALSVGYPRNDALAAAKASDDRRLSVRRGLGLGENDQLLLYAPTWRDDVKDASGNYASVAHLDTKAFHEQLAGSWRIAIRGHANTLKARPGKSVPGVLDVSRYPDVNDLMLAADVLVTDYSSIMFDFCVTGKPMVFLAPDLATYAETTRGFYMDLEQIAPGPVVSTTDELVACIRSLPRLAREYAERYESFVGSFAPWDDGHAAVRVVDGVARAWRDL